MHIPSGEGICTCVVQYFSMVLYNDFLGQIVPIGLLNSCVSVSTCITCPYTHIRYIAQMPSPEGICTVQLRDSRILLLVLMNTGRILDLDLASTGDSRS